MTNSQHKYKHNYDCLNSQIFFFLNFLQHQAQEEENAKEGGQQNKNNKQLKLSWRTKYNERRGSFAVKEMHAYLKVVNVS